MLQIYLDVQASAMLDKSLDYQRWDEDTKILNVVFTNVLSGGDKGLLDGMVTANS